MSESPIVNQLTGPQSIDAEPSALCTLGHPPLVMTGSIIWILRRHFAQSRNIVDPDLKDYVWDEGVTESKITIESVSRWTGTPTQAVQQRPGIYIKRNKYGRVKLGIGDRYMLGSNSTVASLDGSPHNAIDSGTRYGVIIVGSHTIFCVGASGAEAEAIGTEVFFELMEFTPLIRRDLHLNKVDVMEAGGLSKLEESEEHFVVPVTLTYAFNHDWALRQDAPRLKSVTLTA